LTRHWFHPVHQPTPASRIPDILCGAHPLARPLKFQYTGGCSVKMNRLHLICEINLVPLYPISGLRANFSHSYAPKYHYGCLAKADHFIHPHMKFALRLGRGVRYFDFRSKSIRGLIYINLLDILDSMIHIVSKVPQCVI
jgi:hypothetical protein